MEEYNSSYNNNINLYIFLKYQYNTVHNYNNKI